MTWQPIETAPKDEDTGLILVWDGRIVRPAFWDDLEGWLDAADHNGCDHAFLDPTHWMPLPSPPVPLG